MANQVATKYTITGGDGTRVVLNDPTDLDYVGRLDADGITGLDSPEVRESADTLVEADGGVHGNFYYGRRPTTWKGFIEPGSFTEQNRRIDKLQQAINTCLRNDGIIRWTEDGSIERQLTFRAQQPTRIAGIRPKTFFLGLVSKDAAIYSSALQSVAIPAAGTVSPGGFRFSIKFPLTFNTGTGIGGQSIVNLGNYPTPPSFHLVGPITNPILRNATVGADLRLNTTLLAGQYLDIDTVNNTITLNGTTNAYNALDFANSTWWQLVSGNNDIRLLGTSYSAPAALTVTWRHAFI